MMHDSVETTGAAPQTLLAKHMAHMLRVCYHKYIQTCMDINHEYPITPVPLWIARYPMIGMMI